MIVFSIWEVAVCLCLCYLSHMPSISAFHSKFSQRPSLYRGKQSSIRYISPLSDLKRQSASEDKEYDVIIIGSGIGGLSAASILSAVYKLRVAVYEAHTHPGGCAHSFPIKARTSKGKNNLQKATYNFDSGPTIILGCQSEPYNPLRQVFNMLGAESEIDWIGWDRWGMATEDGKWHFQLGNDHFENGPLKRFGGENAVSEFRNLREECAPLTTGAANIPTKALRGDGFKLLPLLPYMSELQKVIPYADILNGNFKPFMDKHISDPWLRSWLDALAFSLSGLPAAETGAAAMAYTIYDLHREGASLDYPTGGMGKIAETFVNVIERTGGRVYFNSPVTNIRVSQGSKEARAEGISLSDGSFIRAKRGIICNAPIWSLPSLLKSDLDKLSADQRRFFMEEAANKNFTKSFMHLHLGLDSNGLDLSKFEPHYTVMDQGLHTADPCADRNMVAVSNPSVLDSSLVDTEDKIIVHAYSAGNEDYGRWGKYKNDRNSEEYKKFKSQDSKFLYEAVSRSLGISVVEIKERAEVSLEGSPLTHERFLRRYRGTYGSAWGAMQDGPLTPLKGLYLAGDSIFPGIGVPAVALSGASAANTLVTVVRHMIEVMK